MIHKIPQGERGRVTLPQQKLEPTRPYLYTLADELLMAERDHWNVIIGDDTAGRLPTLFVRKVLQSAGYIAPTYFVAGSKQYRSVRGEVPYKERFAEIAADINEPLRPLVVTESIDTGEGISFLAEAAKELSEDGYTPEVATVAVSKVGRQYATYAGGTGGRALGHVWRAYESPPSEISKKQKIAKAALNTMPTSLKQSIKQHTSVRIMKSPAAKNTALSIEPDIHVDVPIAKRSNECNGTLRAEWYTAMLGIVAVYCHTRGLDLDR